MDKETGKAPGWLARFWRKLCGWEECPCCHELTLTWHKVALYHPEEPPMFGWWECVACKRSTGVMPTGLTEDAVKSLGYRNFDDYATALATQEDSSHE